jgi:hypothetical protein
MDNRTRKRHNSRRWLLAECRGVVEGRGDTATGHRCA